MPDALTETKIADFRRRICDTAVRQLAENGLENLSMRNLARELGYSATALYSYFRNKEEILVAVRAETFNRLADELETAQAGSPDPWIKLRDAVEAYGRFAATQQTAYRLAFAYGQAPAEQYPAQAEAETRFRTLLQQLTANLVDNGVLSGDADNLANMVWATLHGVIALSLAAKLHPPDTPDILWQQILALLIRGASGATGKKPSVKSTDKQFQLDL